jgi:hypothetical protein
VSLHDQRSPDAPPCDALAEAMALDHLTFCCYERFDTVDLEPLLVFPEHVWLWRTATRVKARMTDPRGAAFFLEYLAEIRRTHTRAEAVVNLVLYARERATERGFDDYAQVADDDPRLAPHLRAHDLDYWLARLERIAEARRGIRAAQEIAERYWRTPEREFSRTEAAAIFAKALPKRETLADRVLVV